VKIRHVILPCLISIAFLFGSCGQPPEQGQKKGEPVALQKADGQKKAVRVRHLSGEVLAVSSQTKTITVKFKDEEVLLHFDDSTVVRMDLESVKPSDIPLGTRATVKFVERKGQYVARGIFVSTETAEKKEGSPRSFFRNSAKRGTPCYETRALSCT
jgi:hypothetical protein